MAIQVSGNTVITNARKGQFQVMNIGAFASDPTAGQTGGLAAGDMYWNTTDNEFKVYDGSAWS